MRESTAPAAFLSGIVAKNQISTLEKQSLILSFASNAVQILADSIFVECILKGYFDRAAITYFLDFWRRATYRLIDIHANTHASLASNIS